jgi:hypothetical protein
MLLILFVLTKGQRRRWKDNIKMDIEVEYGSGDFNHLLNMRFIDRLLCTL